MRPIHIPEDWDDRGLISFEEFCGPNLYPAANRPRLAQTRRRTPLDTLRRLQPALRLGARSPTLHQLRRHLPPLQHHHGGDRS
jgi:hypothetical protein